MTPPIRSDIVSGLGETPAVSSAAAASFRPPSINEDLFLQLMVAQLRNQNPLNPVDGVDFLMQLSQISGVEQMVAVRRELAAIREAIDNAIQLSSRNAEPPARLKHSTVSLQSK